MTIQMEALGYQKYGGKWFTRGETIPVVSEQDASDMTAMHLARRLPAKKPEAPVPHKERSMTPEPEDSALAQRPDPSPEATDEDEKAKEEKPREGPPAPKRGQYLHRGGARRG